MIIFDLINDIGGGSGDLTSILALLEAEIDAECWIHQPVLVESSMGIDAP